MDSEAPLDGTSVCVAGAGLAGLTAAAALWRAGATPLVVDPRPRSGARVWTLREPFVEGQHAEAGGDFIDETQSDIRALVASLGLELAPILPGGFSAIRRRAGARDDRAIEGWMRLRRALDGEVHAYRRDERRWDGPVAAALARESLARWLDRVGADAELRSTASAMRGFFLADPAELSLLAVVDQFADEEAPGQGRMYRVRGGNDRLVAALAGRLAGFVQLETALVAVRQWPQRLEAALRGPDGRVSRRRFDYVVCTLPAGPLLDVEIEPALPPRQRLALEQLAYGAATKTALQFDRPVWRDRHGSRAYGTDLPIGAVWDGSEDQPGAAGILVLYAGASASAATRRLLRDRGVEALLAQLDWLHVDRARLMAYRSISWETDRWARGGYAFFPAGYDASGRAWLARRCGRLFFAGEHTSVRWQGYMNGAVESGSRAAAELTAFHRTGRRRPPE